MAYFSWNFHVRPINDTRLAAILNFQEIEGSIKDPLPIFKDMHMNRDLTLDTESRHPQRHADVFGFLITQFLAEKNDFF